MPLAGGALQPLKSVLFKDNREVDLPSDPDHPAVRSVVIETKNTSWPTVAVRMSHPANTMTELRDSCLISSWISCTGRTQTAGSMQPRQTCGACQFQRNPEPPSSEVVHQLQTRKCLAENILFRQRDGKKQVSGCSEKGNNLGFAKSKERAQRFFFSN